MRRWLRTNWWVAGLLLALAVALLSPLASKHPDGLVRVAQDQGFAQQARRSPLQVIPHYLFPGIHDEGTARVVSGVVGTLLVFGLAFAIARLARRKWPED